MADPELTDIVLPMFDAFLDGDGETVAALADQHVATLGDAAEILARVPEPFRENADVAQAWVQFAVALAQRLAAGGDDRLLTRIMAPADNPILQWQTALGRAQELRDDGQFAESDAALAPAIAGLRTSQGSAVDSMLPKVLGIAGANAFDRGDTETALQLTDEALRECERTGDTEGVATYSQNLATIAAAATDGGSTVRQRLARAQQLHDAGRLDEARVLGEEITVALSTGADAEARYLAKAHGLLGMVLYRLGDLAGAEVHTRAALDAGREHGDEAAVVIYGANLEVIGRGR
jgi:tetratricopeptide (TPR) repeat protein